MLKVGESRMIGGSAQTGSQMMASEIRMIGAGKTHGG